ncbi:hypothetical protein FB192DRAFT_1289074, partial [Mucor lusitanicus]
QELLIKYALAHPDVRFSLHQARDTVGHSSSNANNSWIKPVTASINEALAIIYGSQLANMVERFVETHASHPTLTVDMIVPKRNSDPSVVYKGGDRVFIYVNQRPINYVKSELKDLVTCIKDKHREAIGLGEINIEPNKTTIFFQNKQLIYDLVKQMLNKAYPSTLDALFSKQAQKEEPPDVIASAENTKSDKPKVINTTPMANWQIDTVSSVTEPTAAASKADNTPKKHMQSIPENDTIITRDSISSRSSSVPTSSRAAPPTNSITPTFIAPQKRAVSSDDDIPTSRANKRISLPYVNRQRESPASLEPLDIVEDFIAPPARPSFTLQSSPQIPAASRSISLERSTTPRPTTFVSPSTGRSTTNKQQQPSPATVQSTQKSKGTHQLGLLEAFKRKAYIQKVPASATAAAAASITTTTTSTQNQSLVIQCDINQIKANYPEYKKQHDKTHLLNIADYLATHHETPDIDMNARLISTAATSKGLSFYSRGGVFELGVVKLKALGVNAIYNQLLKNHKVVCKRKLNRPVQIQFRQDDPLCASLIALDTKDIVVDDDLHGNKKMAYYEITEDCVVDNGFNVRWRKGNKLVG